VALGELTGGQDTYLGVVSAALVAPAASDVPGTCTLTGSGGDYSFPSVSTPNGAVVAGTAGFAATAAMHLELCTTVRVTTANGSFTGYYDASSGRLETVPGACAPVGVMDTATPTPIGSCGVAAVVPGAIITNTR
jgi:hypothetical protein